jgi:ribosomal protein S18 acetylase RimI-like enzyme
MIFRPYFGGDPGPLEEFRCATKRDPKHERFVNRMLRTQLLKVLADPQRDVRAFVCETDDGALLGIATMERSRAIGQWELSVLGVANRAKGCGVGRALVKFAVANTPECHDGAILFQVHENNVTMRRLLRTFGAERVEDADSRGYLIEAIEPKVVMRGLYAAMNRARRTWERERRDRDRESASLTLGRRL